jgi:hypothetical protein
VGTDYQPDAGEPVEDMKKISTDERPIEHSAGMRCAVAHELQEQTANCTASLLWWTCTTTAQIVIESKEDARKRGVKRRRPCRGRQCSPMPRS